MIHFLHRQHFVKLLCKPKDQVARENKNNIFCEIDCRNCKSVYFWWIQTLFKTAFRWTQKVVRNCDCEKNETAKSCWEADSKFSWDQEKVPNRKSRLVLRKMKETIHSLKNRNHVNKISYIISLSEIWLPSLR